MKAKLKYIVVAVLILVVVAIYLVMTQKSSNVVVAEEVDSKVKEEIKDTSESVYVDIKGSVKKPGVYKVDKTSIVNDVIKLAGGFTKNAYTKNINLSKHVSDEMVIYVFSKKDFTTTTTTEKNEVSFTTEVINYDNCITTTKEATTKSDIVNINTASKEELMSISGIGASKADLIIAYRLEHKFSKIEDIMNVSGIGESLFEKIKKYITV